jgi:hypothetical protein
MVLPVGPAHRMVKSIREVGNASEVGPVESGGVERRGMESQDE